METVTSADGTTIAYDQAGQGPVLVVCVGAFCTRHSFVPPAELTRRFTVVTYDRRGRGDSSDTDPFAPEREYEDLAAVAVAAATGIEPPFVFGHSSGAAIALRAAARGLRAAGIAAYEAPFTNDEAPPPPPAAADRIRELVAAGRERDAVIFWMTDVIHLPEEATAGLQDAPWVADLAPLARTLPYDIAVTAGGVPADELAKVDIPVLVIGGGNSPGWFQRSVAEQTAALPAARQTTLSGYDHNAPPEVLAPILAEFFTTGR
jgi:pimeloyl-ACP methyl ester carboxylesterase